MSNNIPKIVKGFMAYWFDEKFKLPKFRLFTLEPKSDSQIVHHVTQLFQNWTQKHMEQ